MTTPRNCPACETRVEVGQSFCDACGAVLSWTDRSTPTTPEARSGPGPASGSASGSGSGDDQREAAGRERWDRQTAGAAAHGGHADDSAPTPHAAPAPSSPPPSAAHSPSNRGQSASEQATFPDAGLARAGDQSAQAAETLRDATSQVAPVDGTAPTVPGQAAAPPPAESPDADRARQLLVPLAEPGPGPAPDPVAAPVLPARPPAHRPQDVRAPGEQRGQEGGTPCPWCATPNRPDRHYCTRCAMPMVGAEQAPGPLPWWRRLTRPGEREAPWAGDRPRPRRAFDRVLTWLGAAVVLALLVVLVVKLPDGIQATRDHFAKRAPLTPDRMKASLSFKDHGPELLIDKVNNTWWAPGNDGSNKGEWIEAQFDRPTRLLDVIITPGTSVKQNEISKAALPHRVQALITTSDGKTTTRSLVLDQGAGPQSRKFKVGEVTAVRFIIESAHHPGPGKQLAIAEVEFFGPSQSGSR
ncbi:NADase-type glycan-binding domain-containing protein [Streptomyces sp. NPDC020412]|uniref:NADase-type glycan-binding domain-containing protein n=1 Tax=Streptomyces sp. NPDC020412 TaxID=3365073 RepID=UPI0037AAFBDA